MRASSRSTCSASECSPRSRTASSRSRPRNGEVIDLSRIPFDDPEVFADIQRADTVGAFQIESRAQMQSLLRTKPENLDDLTAQVALVRPGPIQGKAVHPYIEARERLRDGSVVRLAGRPRAPAGAAALDVRRRHLPGPGARGRDRACRIHGGGSRGIAAGDEQEAKPGRARGVPRAVRRRRREEGSRCRDCGRRLRQARRLLRLRLPESTRGRVRPARLPVAVAAPALRRRVPVRAPERAADGLLPTCDPRPRRAAARGGGAAARREPERGEVRDRALWR